MNNNIREQIINFLLQSCDQKDNIIAALQKKLGEVTKPTSTTDPVTQPISTNSTASQA